MLLRKVQETGQLQTDWRRLEDSINDPNCLNAFSHDFTQLLEELGNTDDEQAKPISDRGRKMFEAAFDRTRELSAQAGKLWREVWCRAEEEQERAEHRFDVFSWISYVLYTVGWGLSLWSGKFAEEDTSD